MTTLTGAWEMVAEPENTEIKWDLFKIPEQNVGGQVTTPEVPCTVDLRPGPGTLIPAEQPMGPWTTRH